MITHQHFIRSVIRNHMLTRQRHVINSIDVQTVKFLKYRSLLKITSKVSVESALH